MQNYATINYNTIKIDKHHRIRQGIKQKAIVANQHFTPADIPN